MISATIDEPQRKVAKVARALCLALMAILPAFFACARGSIMPIDAAPASGPDGAGAGRQDAPAADGRVSVEPTVDAVLGCGAATQPCCAGSACGSGGCCVGGNCIAAGESCIAF